MRTIGRSILTAAAAAATAAQAQSPSEVLPEGAFGWMAELAGHCWTATHGDGATRDTQCYSVQYGRFLRGTIAIESVGSGRTPYLGDSVFVWDPDRSEMKFYHWSSGGSHGMTVGTVEGARINFPSPPQADPNAPPARTSWTRLGPDRFQVAVQRLIDGRWQDGTTVTYSRVPED